MEAERDSVLVRGGIRVPARADVYLELESGRFVCGRAR